jgi:pimeloyl-ACP methyl ester carboxylesterase
MELSIETVRDRLVPAGLKTAELDGARLAYVERGSGQPVVFVHGSISDLTIWEPQLEPVGASCRAIAYSRHYAWPNGDLPSGAKDMMQPHVDDLLAFLRAVDAYPAHLMGNSWGAFTCLKAAMQEPLAVRSLVLEEPPLVPLITGAPLSPPQIAGSLLHHPLVTLAVLRFATGVVAPVNKLIKAGQVDASINRFAEGVLGKQAFDALPDDVRAHMHANASTHVGQALAHGGFEPCDPRVGGLVAARICAGRRKEDVPRASALLVRSLALGRPRACQGVRPANPLAFPSDAGGLAYGPCVSTTTSGTLAPLPKPAGGTQGIASATGDVERAAERAARCRGRRPRPWHGARRRLWRPTRSGSLSAAGPSCDRYLRGRDMPGAGGF